MSRHRNVRSMNYHDEYEGYDDVYGHSIEENDYCVSPSASHYMYDRSKNHKIDSFFNTVKEEKEDEDDETKKVSTGKESPSTSSTSTSHFVANVNVTPVVSASASEIIKPEPIKVVPIKKGATSVTLGFEISERDRQSSSRTFSPLPLPLPLQDNLDVKSSGNSSGRPSPILREPTDYSAEKSKKSENAIKEYEKEKEERKKDLINLVVIGHVDAGKSTLMGHLLCKLGQVSRKTMHKHEQESKKLGKQSFVYAWVLDETGEERTRGITMDVGQSRFETNTKSIILLDAPGHRDFIPNMITGASQADVALLVVDSTTGEFETGFESGGQTREHALLVRSLGVNQLIVAVNKLDTCNWNQDRFVEIRGKLLSFLTKQAGFRESDIVFIPCSGLSGENLINISEECLLKNWHNNNMTLLQAIDNLRTPERPVGKPLRMTVNDVFKGPGGLCVAGRIETGMLQCGDKVMIQPIGEIGQIKSLTLEEQEMSGNNKAFAGDPLLVTFNQTLTLDPSDLTIGLVLSDPMSPCPVSTTFQARIVTFDTMAIPLTRGFTGVIHIGSISEQIVIKKIISQINKGTGEVVKLKPKCLIRNSNGIVEICSTKQLCLEEFKQCKELGRFTLRTNGVTIAAGIVTKILN